MTWHYWHQWHNPWYPGPHPLATFLYPLHSPDHEWGEAATLNYSVPSESTQQLKIQTNGNIVPLFYFLHIYKGRIQSPDSLQMLFLTDDEELVWSFCISWIPILCVCGISLKMSLIFRFSPAALWRPGPWPAPTPSHLSRCDQCWWYPGHRTPGTLIFPDINMLIIIRT